MSGDKPSIFGSNTYTLRLYISGIKFSYPTYGTLSYPIWRNYATVYLATFKMLRPRSRACRGNDLTARGYVVGILAYLQSRLWEHQTMSHNLRYVVRLFHRHTTYIVRRGTILSTRGRKPIPCPLCLTHTREIDSVFLFDIIPCSAPHRIVFASFI